MKRCILSAVLALVILSLTMVSAIASDMKAAPWDTPYDQTVTISTVGDDMSAYMTFEGDDDLYNNPWTRGLKDYLNIELVNDWFSAEYDSALNLAIASQTLPDFYQVDYVQYKQVLDAGLIMDITDIYEGIASDSLKRYNDADPTVLDIVKKDGRIHGQPRLSYGTINQLGYIWLRKDWMAEMGATEPKTMDDVTNILSQMNEKYGAKGMVVEKTLDHLFLIAPSWHAYPRIWITKPDGSIEHGAVQPEMKDALAQWAAWYADGLIHPEFASKDYSAVVSDCANNVTGAFPWWQWGGGAMGPACIENNGSNDAYFEPYLVPTVDGEQQLAQLKFQFGDRIIVVNKDCENPEAVMKAICFYIDMMDDALPAGRITKDVYDTYALNNMDQLPSFQVVNTLGEYEQFEMVQTAMKTGDTSVLTNPWALFKYETARDWLDKGDLSTDGLGNMLQLGCERCSYALSKPYVDNEWWMRDAMWGPQPEALTRSGSTLTDILKEGFTLIIMGVEPIDYFDDLVSAWYAAGGQEATDAVNAEYRK